MTEKFWEEEKKKTDANTYLSNKLWKQTWEDMRSIKSDTHPKALYIECLKNSTYLHHYAASDKLSIDDLAMLVCKDLGCEINYCSLIKKSVPMEWEGSSDCSSEISNFNKCMQLERRRYMW
jgi:hypothetical protein